MDTCLIIIPVPSFKTLVLKRWSWQSPCSPNLHKAFLIRLLYTNLSCQLINKSLFRVVYRWKRYMAVSNFGNFYFRLLVCLWHEKLVFFAFSNDLLHNEWKKTDDVTKKSDAWHLYLPILHIAVTNTYQRMAFI